MTSSTARSGDLKASDCLPFWLGVPDWLKVFPKVLAAFWAAETQLEKNEPDGADKVPPGVLVSSSVGVNGDAEIALANLLPPKLADLGRDRTPEVELVGLLVGERDSLGVEAFFGGDSSWGKVGVGGVTNVLRLGVEFGGVFGRPEVSILGMRRVDLTSMLRSSLSSVTCSVAVWFAISVLYTGPVLSWLLSNSAALPATPLPTGAEATGNVSAASCFFGRLKSDFKGLGGLSTLGEGLAKFCCVVSAAVSEARIVD